MIEKKALGFAGGFFIIFNICNQVVMYFHTDISVNLYNVTI